MWSPLSKIFETIGRFRFPFLRLRTNLIVGRVNAPDYLGGTVWKAYLDGRKLSGVWGPHPNSPWMPFHCITLFASLDYLKHDVVGPCEGDPWPVKDFALPNWVDSATMVVVDMAGPKSVAFGAALGVAGCDLVCTFNNWPHPKGVILPQETLAALLRYAPWLAAERAAFPTPAPVAWLCDTGRLGTRPGKPGDFDNRYYLDDALFPGPKYLRERGISRVVWVTELTDTLNADVAVHLHAYQKEGFTIGRTAAGDGLLREPQVVNLPPPSFKSAGFMRSSAGGFGAPVPHPSSGG